MEKRAPHDRIVFETELAALAKKLRLKAGVSKAEAARQLGVNRGTIQQAEEYPQTSLTKLRIRMIEAFSSSSVKGPAYIVSNH